MELHRNTGSNFSVSNLNGYVCVESKIAEICSFSFFIRNSKRRKAVNFYNKSFVCFSIIKNFNYFSIFFF